MSRKLTLLLSSIVAFGATIAPVHADPLYRWESADGTVSFTDDAKRVPERYREATQEIDTNALGNYGRYTPVDAAATADYEKRLNERLEALRAANEMDEVVVDAEAVAAGAAPAKPNVLQKRRPMRNRDGSLVKNLDGSVRYRNYQVEAPQSASLPVDPNDPSPVVTEYKRVKLPLEPTTTMMIVVRQGDRVLSVTPRTQPAYNKLDFGTMSDFENPTLD